MSLETPVTTREKVRVFVTGSCDGLAELREALGRHSEVEMVGWSEGVLESAATLTGGHLQVVLHGTRSSGLPEDELAAIREHTQSPVILLASGEASALLEQALEADVSDVLLLPQMTENVVFALRKASHSGRRVGGGGGASGRRGRIVTVFSPKGGTGKTVTATNLASTFAKYEGKKTLLLDLDLQFGDAAIMQAPWVVAVGFVAGACIPYAVVAYKARKRLQAFEEQLPDILVTMAASLKAGHSFRQGMQSVVDEGVDPAHREFKRVLTEARLGRPMDDALTEMALRIGSKNFEFVMSAVTIQRQVGGSLAGLFDMVADTVRQRQQFRRKIKGLTAMGRMSAYVLVGLPFVVGAAIWLINRAYMEPLFYTSTGHKLILLVFVMMGIGSAILKKIVSFKG